MLLQEWGHDVVPSYSGAAALQIADSFCPDAVILDLVMPGMDGCEVARQLRQTDGGKLTIICVSGHGKPEHRRQSKEAGRAYHLLKPADLDELQRLLAACPSNPAGSPG